MCTVVFLKESDTSLWRSQTKLIFKWTKATVTVLAKQKHGVITMHINVCVTFDMSFATPQSTALLSFFKKNVYYRAQHIMPFRNNSVKQHGLED